MGYSMFPIAILMAFLGWTAQARVGSQTVPGSGLVGSMEAQAAVGAQKAEAFATSCLNAVTASPGVTSPHFPVTMPSAVQIPQGAVCNVAAGPGPQRTFYAYLPVPPGAVGIVLSDTLGSADWYRVSSPGSATNLTTGGTLAVPAAISVGALVRSAIIN